MMRATSTVLMGSKAFRVSLLPPPLRPARSWPPRFGLAVEGCAEGWVDVLQLAIRAPRPTALTPLAVRPMKSRRFHRGACCSRTPSTLVTSPCDEEALAGSDPPEESLKRPVLIMLPFSLPRSRRAKYYVAAFAA